MVYALVAVYWYSVVCASCEGKKPARERSVLAQAGARVCTIDDVKLSLLGDKGAGALGAGSAKIGPKCTELTHDYDGKGDQKARFLLDTCTRYLGIVGEKLPKNMQELQVTMAVKIKTTGEPDLGRYVSMVMDTRTMQHARKGGRFCDYRLDVKHVDGGASDEDVFPEMDTLRRVFGKPVVSEDIGIGVD